MPEIEDAVGALFLVRIAEGREGGYRDEHAVDPPPPTGPHDVADLLSAAMPADLRPARWLQDELGRRRLSPDGAAHLARLQREVERDGPTHETWQTIDAEVERALLVLASRRELG